MLEGRCRLGLLNEAPLTFGIREELRRQHLERNIPLQLDVVSTVDDAHAPAADLVEHLVVGKDSPNQCGLLFAG